MCDCVASLEQAPSIYALSVYSVPFAWTKHFASRLGDCQITLAIACSADPSLLSGALPGPGVPAPSHASAQGHSQGKVPCTATARCWVLGSFMGAPACRSRLYDWQHKGACVQATMLTAQLL